MIILESRFMGIIYAQHPHKNHLRYHNAVVFYPHPPTFHSHQISAHLVRIFCALYAHPVRTKMYFCNATADVLQCLCNATAKSLLFSALSDL